MNIKTYLKQNTSRQYIQYLLGIFIITFGVTLVIKANLGTGAWDSVFVGLFYAFGLTVGTMMFLTNLAILFLNAILMKQKTLNLKSMITVIIGSLMVDFWLEIVFANADFSNYILQIFFFITGAIAICFGLALYIRTKIFPGPLEDLMFASSKRFNLSTGKARTMNEIGALFIGFLLGGPIGIGTIIITLWVGFGLQFFLKVLEKLNKKVSFMY